MKTPVELVNDLCSNYCFCQWASPKCEVCEMKVGIVAIITSDRAHYEEKLKQKDKALRNCLLMANQQAHAFRGSLTAEKWQHIQRFCKEGGVESSPFREEA